MSEKEIANFLYYVYGYQKVAELLDHQKPRGESLKDFFRGTIIGTYRRTVFDGESGDKVNSKYPKISKIKKTQELIESNLITESGNVDKGLEYHLVNRSFFEGQNRDKVFEYLNQHMAEFFERLEVRETRIGEINERRIITRRRWVYDARSENFHLAVEGSDSNFSKLLLIDFTISPEVCDQLNKLMHRYYSIAQVVFNYQKKDKVQEGEVRSSP